MRAVTIVIFLALFRVLTAVPVACGEQPGATDAVRVTADSLTHEAREERFEARGNVQILWDGTTLSADRAVLRQRVKEAEADGHVVLSKDNNVLRSDRLRVNYDSQLGEAENSDLFVPQGNFHLRSRKMSRVNEARFLMTDGSFTTCDGPDPSWHFEATDLDVTVEGLAEGKNALFYLGNMPVLYSPYVLFPVKRERQTGFLLPRFGNSSKKGFNVDLPFYWATTPSQDATFDLDMQTKRGVGLGAEYRYQRSAESQGRVREYFIYDTDKRKGRGDVEAKVYDAVTSGLTLRSDLHLTLDREFFKDYGEIAGDYNKQLLDSSLSLSHRWDAALVTAEARYVEDLYADNNRQTLQRLPTLTGSVVGRRLGELPLYASLSAEYTHFQSTEGARGERVDLHPTLDLHLPGIDPVSVVFRGGYRERLYDAYGAQATGKGRDAGLAEGGVTASTVLERVYGVGWGELKKLRNSLLPEVSFEYLQEKSDARLPLFDYDDRLATGSQLSWRLTSYLGGKFQHDDVSEYRDLLFLRLSQGYLLSGTRRDLLTLVDDGRRFSDLRLEARFTPWQRFALTTDSRFNPYRTDFSMATVTAELSDTGGNSVGAGYRRIRGEAEYLEGKLGLALVKPFVFNYTGRYSIDGEAFLESFYSLEFKRQCWSIALSYRDRPGNREFMVNFTLSGVGSLGPVKAF